ncbi:protein peste isoform X2 [Leptinotarsa decemlineata]|uniref:protein peste isoform X2 n=1 Tax=Leptinotarsa decemlineata TaxID=7539 RepID=UPI003D308B0C
MAYRMLSRKHLAMLTFFCGMSIFCIIFGILVIILWWVLHDAILRSQLVLKPGNTAYDVWIKNPVPLTLKFHMFNWTNPEDIYNTSTKLKFQELGPYVYRETKEKVNVTWNANETVTFRTVKTWWFDQESSNGSVHDAFTTINPVALSAAFVARNWHYMIKKGLSVSLRSLIDSIAITQSVGKVLFTGYEDPLMTTASKIPFLSLKSLPFKDKFGWFYGRNGSENYEGVFEMDTGFSGHLGELRSWNYAKYSSFYQGECGGLKDSSSGEFFPRELTKESIIKLFSPDLCRFMELEYEKEIVINGVVGYKYSAGQRFLDNGTLIPENKCFCEGDCMPSGTVNVSTCKFGSPAFVSLPYFYKADPYYINSIEGMTPSEEKSDFFLVLEPRTGIPLQVAARLQLNMRLQSIEEIRMYNDVPTVFIPVLYFEQTLTIPENMIYMLKILLNLKYICMAIGILCICTGVLVSVCVIYKIITIKSGPMRRVEMRVKVKEEQPLNQ